MSQKRWKTALTIGFSLCLSVAVNYQVFQDQYSGLLIISWLLSIFLLVLSVLPNHLIRRLLPTKLLPQTVLIALLILLPSTIRIVNYHPQRIHGDDMLTAYFSAHYDLKSQNFFAAIPTDRSEWVSQFPTTYFILQKLFFLVFGESVLTVKLSVIPYVLVVSLMLYLITKNLLGKNSAIISVVFYSFLAISLYLETLGLHFIASTAAFLTFFYFLILSYQSNQPLYSVLTGIFAGFCYLFYSSSYIAFPFMVMVFVISFIARRNLSVLKNLFLAIVSFLVVAGPFFVYALHFENYFLQRINQVSLIKGEWSGVKDRIQQGETTRLLAIKENFELTIKSLYQDGIGGHGGYTFGQKAFFEQFSLYLFITGLLSSLWLVIVRKKTEFFFILIAIAVSFVSVVLSIPPPAYHRFSLAFPLIAIVLALPFYLLLSTSFIPKSLKYLIIPLILLFYAVNNQLYFEKAIIDELNNSNLQVANILRKHYSGRNVYIAAFPYFAFEKIFYFVGGKEAKSVVTDYHQNFLNNFNRNEKYVYLIFSPYDFNQKFSAKDRNGQVLGVTDEYSIFAN